MTQILLNVTTHHIETISKEELDRYKRKHKGIVASWMFFILFDKNKKQLEGKWAIFRFFLYIFRIIIIVN